VGASTTFNWTVNDSSAPALTSPGARTSNEGASVSVTVTAADADAGSFKAVGLPTGLSIDPTTGVISGTIDPRAAGSYSVTVSATDGSVTGSTTFGWTVNDTTPPVLTGPGGQSTKEGDAVSVTVAAVDADPGTFKAVGLPAGLSIDPTTGVISGTLPLGSVGNYSVTVTASDGGVAGSVSFSWSVADPKPPTIANPGNQHSAEGAAVSLAIQATNADHFSATGLPAGLSIDAKTGVISGVIGARAEGSYMVTVTAFGGPSSASAVFTWTVKDATPAALTNPGTQHSKEGERVSLKIGSVDAYGFRAVGLPPGLRIDPNTGVISGVIGARAAGSYSVTVTAHDAGHTTTIHFTWHVADTMPPALSNPGTQTTIAGRRVQLVIHAIDAAPGSFKAAGLPPGLHIDPRTGVISGVIRADAHGTYTVEVTASDNGVTAIVLFRWNVVPRRHK
jgi:hypothetical protein